MSARLVSVAALASVLATAADLAEAWNVRCFDEQSGTDCTDPYDHAQTPWLADPQAEHRAILERTLGLAGLPASVGDDFDLTVFTSGATLTATIAEPGDPPQTFTHTSIRPIALGADARRLRRRVSVPAMASLPDFSYSLWDWAAGNELCPPAPGSDAVDCHNYETHIGWLNSNHMLPQARRFYDYLHGIALERADECKSIHDTLPPADRARFTDYLLACEKLALVVEGVAHHYLQDAWAEGHMWERWGGPEPADFGGNRTLGFAVAGFVGSIHGSKAVLDADPLTSALAPWDDPLNGPHPDATWVDPSSGLIHWGAGDVFLESWLFDPSPNPFMLQVATQRRALLGCAVDGVRKVYERTAQLHGPLAPVAAMSIDPTRNVDTDSCWGQRVTNRALALGCGIHQGQAPAQQRLLPGGITSIVFWALADAQARGLPPLGPALTASFQTDAAYACTLAMAMGAVPIVNDQTGLASGGLPSIAAIRPNSAYARGGAGSPPATWADPELPWSIDVIDPAVRERTEALNLTFADAHVYDRCLDQTEADLLALRSQVDVGNAGGSATVMDARCGQCVQRVAPHLRRGTFGNHDPNREAFCALAGLGGAAFVYSDEDPSSFPGAPTDFPALETATRAWCHCGATPTPTPTATPTPKVSGVTRNSSRGVAHTGVVNEEPCDRNSPAGATAWSDGASCHYADAFGNTADATATASFTETYVGGRLTAVHASSSSSANVQGVDSTVSANGSGVYTLDVAVTESSTVTITATLNGSGVGSGYQMSFHASPGEVFVSEHGFDGFSVPVDETIPLTPGRYILFITTFSNPGVFDGTAAATTDFTVDLTFGP